VVVAAQATELREAPKRSPAPGFMPIRMQSGPRPAPSRTSHGTGSPSLEPRQSRCIGRQVVVAENDPVLVLTNYADDCSYGPVGQKGNHSPWGRHRLRGNG